MFIVPEVVGIVVNYLIYKVKQKPNIFIDFNKQNIYTQKVLIVMFRNKPLISILFIGIYLFFMNIFKKDDDRKRRD